jgi:shikimate dehydrogenase
VSDHYAVIGNPVAHSKSPYIHARFARQTGHDVVYGRILAPLDGFEASVAAFREGGGKGLNVTLPFKLRAYALCGPSGPRAHDAEAVNVLWFDGGTIVGDNTDGLGLVRDIESNLGMPLEGKEVLLIGAGGAAQGAIGPLLAGQPLRLAVANRTPEKARALIERMSSRRELARVRLEARSFTELKGNAFDLVINATSASLAGAIPDIPRGVFASGSLAYDMMYGKGLTPFLELAQREGAGQLADGVGMLVEQAAESFFLWRGVRPRTAEVIDELKSGA